MPENPKNPNELIKVYVDSELANSNSYIPIKEFLNVAAPDLKADRAISAIREIIKPHEKRKIPDTLERLFRVEKILRSTPDPEEKGAISFNVERKRDHVTHALNTYLLGLMVAKHSKLVEKISDFDFQWRLTSLFHDIGYPIEIAMDLIDQSVVYPLNNMVDPTDPTLRGKEYGIKLNFNKFKKLTTGESSLSLIQDCFDKQWGLNVTAKKLCRTITNANEIKHGVISSLLLMAHVDLYYKKNNNKDIDDSDFVGEDGLLCGRDVFRQYVVPPCAAIMLHDAHKHNFKGKMISRGDAPLAWLLRVTDALQDWDRPCKDNPLGFPAEYYSLGFNNGMIQYFCPDDGGRDSKGSRAKAIIKDLSATIYEDVLHIIPRYQPLQGQWR